MNFNIYDIYVDASINNDHKLGCAGMLLVNRKRDVIVDAIYSVKTQATNNMSEIIAIWIGIYRAISLLYTEREPFLVNIFSDSQISLFGMRDWITSWIKNQYDGVLIGSSGPVSNQLWFADSYNAILSSGIKLKFFHQKGHVSLNSPKALFESEKLFVKTNGVTPNNIGLTPQILARYNNSVDQTSRNILIDICEGYKKIDDYLCANIPMTFYCIPADSERYNTLINGGLNYPINFNGGN